MSSEKVEMYANRFLPEVKLALDAVDDEVRLAIISALEEHGDLSFSELQGLLKIQKNRFYYHLKKLMMGGILRSYTTEKTEINPYTSYYSLTELGRSFMTALSRAILPMRLDKDWTLLIEHALVGKWLNSQIQRPSEPIELPAASNISKDWRMEYSSESQRSRGFLIPYLETNELKRRFHIR